MRSFQILAAIALTLLARAAGANMGMTQLPATGQDGPVTVFYPTGEAEQPFTLPRLAFHVAQNAAPQRGNGRLVVVSHGSGGAPWVHTDLARTLVRSGFVVAFPEHHADNAKDDSDPGPDSWTLRPGEVSRAIDAVGRDPRFAPLLRLDKVGMYGMSAGGHTALTMAGGRWSPALFKEHCEAHIAEDFQSCVGLITRLHGSWLDSMRKWAALTVIRWRFDDARLREHNDPRIAAVVAGVPSSADFDMASLEQPRVPLALITAQQDRWLIPRFHSDRVLEVCKTCERLADLPAGGHGALLSPLPSGLSGLIGDLLNDPPRFDRGQMAEVDRKTAAFFEQHLLSADSRGGVHGAADPNTASANASVLPLRR